MNYEQKHQEDLDAAKDWLTIAKKDNNTMAIQILENLFPELSESEDEKIRKEIIKLVHFFYDSSLVCKHLVSENDMIAWLEKQKPIDMIEPKFNVGDIISDGVSEVEIASIDKNKYNVTNGEIENDAHVCNWVVYFKDQEKWKLVEYKSEENKKHPQSKQEWSKENEEMFCSLKKLLNEASCYSCTEGSDKILDWLKSIKPNHWKPSEKQMEALKNFIEAVETSNYAQLYLQWLTGLKSLYNDLKTL